MPKKIRLQLAINQDNQVRIGTKAKKQKAKNE